MRNWVVSIWQRWLGGWLRSRPNERRRSGRCPGPLVTSCEVSATLQSTSRPARVRNLSASGISLVVEQHFEPETLLVIELVNVKRNCISTLPVRVVYCIPHPSGDWILGGAFGRKLRDDEVQGFLL